MANAIAETDDSFLEILFGADAVQCRPWHEIEAEARAEMRAEYEARKAAEAAEIERHRCPRCSGRGRIDAFSHYKGGACFRCCGTGRV